MGQKKLPENLPPMRILIADNYPATCQAIRDAIIDEFGHAFAIHMSETGEAGWEEINTWDYDLLFADEEPWKQFDMVGKVRADQRFASLAIMPVTISARAIAPRSKVVQDFAEGKTVSQTEMITRQIYDVLRNKYHWTPEKTSAPPETPADPTR